MCIKTVFFLLLIWTKLVTQKFLFQSKKCKRKLLNILIKGNDRKIPPATKFWVNVQISILMRSEFFRRKIKVLYPRSTFKWTHLQWNIDATKNKPQTPSFHKLQSMNNIKFFCGNTAINNKWIAKFWYALSVARN